MINIISRSLIIRQGFSGPRKVVTNLIKGLEELKYPFLVNQRLDACSRLYVHDDTIALREVAGLPPEIKVIVGPNLFVLPRDLPADLDLSRAVYLLPSRETQEFWRHFGFAKCPTDVWPAGIDTNEFKPSGQLKDLVLVYFKQREENDLAAAKQALEKKNLRYETLAYGNYKEADYKRLMARAKYVLWIGRHESQGIALQEALACGVPILVWDVTTVGQGGHGGEFNEAEKKFPHTSAAYFDGTCGIKIKSAGELDAALAAMEGSWQKFTPRSYILEHLSLAGQAKALLMLYEKHFQLPYEAGFAERRRVSGAWLNGRPGYVAYIKFRHFVKMVLVQLGIWRFFRR